MYRMLFGMMAGVALALVGIYVFQVEKSASQNELSKSQAPTSTNLERAVTEIASELALLQASVDGLNAKISLFPAGARHESENVAQSQPGPVAAPVDITGLQTDNSVDSQVSALQKQDALNKLVDPGITLPDFMASAQFMELPPEEQEEVMQELVRRFNSGEIDREQFVPGYKY